MPPPSVLGKANWTIVATLPCQERMRVARDFWHLRSGLWVGRIFPSRLPAAP
jgi:hypothetical protein